VVVSVLTGIPFTLALMTWSFWYPLRAFQRQPELWQSEESPARHERRPGLVFRQSSSLIGRFNEESALWCYGRTLALFQREGDSAAQREGDSAAQRDALRTVREAGESHPLRLGRCLPRIGAGTLESARRVDEKDPDHLGPGRERAPAPGRRPGS